MYAAWNDKTKLPPLQSAELSRLSPSLTAFYTIIAALRMLIIPVRNMDLVILRSNNGHFQQISVWWIVVSKAWGQKNYRTFIPNSQEIMWVIPL